MDSLVAEKRFHGGVQLPESPTEFLSRSWSTSAAVGICKPAAFSPPPSSSLCKVSAGACKSAAAATNASPENTFHDGELSAKLFGNSSSFCFASSATSQMVLERIMSQSMQNEHEISPLTSGRLSHSSGSLNINAALAEDAESPPFSPNEEFEDVVKYLRANNSLQPLFTNIRNGNGSSSAAGGGKTVGKWLKEKREKKKEECRARNAQLHAAVTVAGVAASVAAIAASAASPGKDDETTAAVQTDMAVASAAMLVAAQCVEAAESMGADRDHLMAAITSAVNVRSHGDISTLTAAATTALRGAATMKARALKEVWNIPVEKGIGAGGSGNNGGCLEGLDMEEDFLGACNQELLARGRELLKRTREGELHWKVVSVYIHRSGEVVLKMKSKYMANTVTKKKKNVVIEVCREIRAWAGRHLLEDGEQRRYFGLRTQERGVVEFECKNQKEYDLWTQGVSRLLSMVATVKRKRNPPPKSGVHIVPFTASPSYTMY